MKPTLVIFYLINPYKSLSTKFPTALKIKTLVCVFFYFWQIKVSADAMFGERALLPGLVESKRNGLALDELQSQSAAAIT